VRVLVQGLVAAPGGSLTVLHDLVAAWPDEDELLVLCWRPAAAEMLATTGRDVQRLAVRSTGEGLLRRVLGLASAPPRLPTGRGVVAGDPRRCRHVQPSPRRCTTATSAASRRSTPAHRVAGSRSASSVAISSARTCASSTALPCGRGRARAIPSRHRSACGRPCTTASCWSRSPRSQVQPRTARPRAAVAPAAVRPRAQAQPAGGGRAAERA
jgi:hypothetical protein